MAKKNKSSLEDAINIFQDAMQRASLSDYINVNRTLLSKNNNDNSVIIIIDQTLWNALIEIPEIKNNVRELDITKSEESSMVPICTQCNDSSDSWIEIDCEELYSGKVIKIKVEGFEYDISINKALIPLKLKKSEFNNVSYRIFPDTMTFALKKRFEYPLEDHGFEVIRIFQIV